jgi:hypothetical protein
MVHDSLRRYNKNPSVLLVWKYNGTQFFRSAITNADDSNTLLLGQWLNEKTGGWNHLNFSPIENYFVGQDKNNLIAVNNVLLELKGTENKEKPDVPIKTSEGWTQTEPIIDCICNNVNDYDGICFMVVKWMEGLI